MGTTDDVEDGFGPTSDTPSFGPYEGDRDARLNRALSELGIRKRRTQDRATKRATRAVRQRVNELFGAGGPAFRHLALSHATSTAGDTLVAVALANSLFFTVPSAEARGNVALYLLLTMAPFTLIGPVLTRIFDRPGTERSVLIAASGIRVGVAVALVLLSETVWLFPLAFTLLVLGRVHGIARSTLLPQALTNAVALVTANARLAQISVLGGGTAAAIGAALSAINPQTVLIGAAVAFGIATVESVALPRVDVAPLPDEIAEPRRAPLPLRTAEPLTAQLVDPSDASSVAADRDPTGEQEVVGADRDRSQLRLARTATAVVRLLNGFLVLLLAFAFRDVDAPLADFGAVLAAAGGGYALAAMVAPRLERSLAEEPMVVAALAVEAAAAFIAGQFFNLGVAVFLSLAAGYAWGTAKFGFDGLMQATLAPEERGRAFTKSETIFQLAWVLGAFAPTGLTIDVRIGLLIAGVVALFAQTIYVSRLLQRI